MQFSSWDSLLSRRVQGMDMLSKERGLYGIPQHEGMCEGTSFQCQAPRTREKEQRGSERRTSGHSVTANVCTQEKTLRPRTTCMLQLQGSNITQSHRLLK